MLKAANHDSRDVLLVYASDEAILPIAPLPLPEPLDTFVKVDNRLFKEERDEAIAEADTDASANVNAMDASWGNEYAEVELPPAYDSNDAWVPDPGPNVLSNAEYQYNSNTQFTSTDASGSSSRYLDPLIESVGHPTPERTPDMASVAQTDVEVMGAGTNPTLNPTHLAVASSPRPRVADYVGAGKGGESSEFVGVAGGRQGQRQGQQGKGGAQHIEDVDMA